MFRELLSHLYALEFFYKTAHWTVKTPLFYGDHLLFDRLSEEASKRIDQVAEKGIGITQDLSVVHLPTLLKSIFNLVKDLSFSNKDNAKFFEESLKLENTFISFCKKFNKSQEATLGTQNLIQDLVDEAEGRVYLIKQRILNENKK